MADCPCAQQPQLPGQGAGGAPEPPGDAAGAQGVRNTRGLGAGTMLGSSFTDWSH